MLCEQEHLAQQQHKAEKQFASQRAAARVALERMRSEITWTDDEDE